MSNLSVSWKLWLEKTCGKGSQAWHSFCEGRAKGKLGRTIETGWILEQCRWGDDDDCWPESTCLGVSDESWDFLCSMSLKWLPPPSGSPGTNKGPTWWNVPGSPMLVVQGGCCAFKVSCDQVSLRREWAGRGFAEGCPVPRTTLGLSWSLQTLHLLFTHELAYFPRMLSHSFLWHNY